MTGESNYFRKRLFGGFNRKDVVNYIAKMAQERNELAAARDRFEEEARALSGEITALRQKTEEASRAMQEDHEHKASVFETAGNVFKEFEEVFRGLQTDIEAAVANVFEELKNTGDMTARLPSVLAQAGESLNELRKLFGIDINTAADTGSEAKGSYETCNANEADAEASIVEEADQAIEIADIVA